MRWKWLTGAVFAAVIALAIAGCDGSSSSSSEESGGSEGTTASAGDNSFTIGFSNYAGSIAYYQKMVAGLKSQVEPNGGTVLVTDSNFDLNQQVTDVQSLITRHVDVILTSPGSEDAMVPAYTAAKEAGIPVISVGNHIAESASELQLTYYGYKWVLAGEEKTKALAKAIGGSGEIGVIHGPSGVAFVEEEGEGIKNVLGENPGMEVVGEQFAKDLTAGEGLRIAEAMLTANPEIAGFWVETDPIAEGVVRALQSRGLAGKVAIVSLDGDPPAMKLVQSGDITYSLALPTYSWGKQQGELVEEVLLEEKTPPPYIQGPAIGVTKSNVDKVLATCKTEPHEIFCG